MSIALITYSTKPRGGVVHTLHLAEALAAAGARVTVWSLARAGDVGFFRAVDPAVTVRLVDFPTVDGESVTERIVRSIEGMRAAVRLDDYDIVHAQDCISANAVGTCIRTVHHLDTFTTPILVECHEKAIVTPYAHICVSQAVADEVHHGWGVSPTVIPNGVAAGRFAAAAADTEEATRARRRWTDRLGDYVLAVGGIEPRKGTIDLVRAVARLQTIRPEMSLVIAGGETLFDYRDYRSEFESTCAAFNVDPVVLGAVDDDELPALVAACRVFAFPSTKEGFGLAAMEALAAGRPVVARDLPVLREVFGDTVRYAGDVTGLAQELGDACQHPSTTRDRAAGQAVAAALTWDVAARAHLDFYRRHPRP
ncbi:MSMEG_0565 family glycosyltransferase [Williamsia sp. CHRR-6]|nr:MSMEG_0565 family glycosyltransferase [Williamsia sp. CHRR-6]